MTWTRPASGPAATPPTAPHGDDPITATPTFDTLPINVLFPHPANVRRELTGIEELADSIRSEGLHQPLVVTPRVDDPGSYTVIMGHRRLAASRAAGKTFAPCVIRTDLDSEEKVLSAMLAENCARNDLTVSEEGDAFQRLLELDLSPATIGKRAGRSRKQVTDRVTVASQSEKVRTAVDDKQITLADALTLAEFADDHQRYARLEETIGTPRFDYELQSAVMYRKNAQRAVELRAEAIEAGHVELDRDHLPEGATLEKMYMYGETPEVADNIRFEMFSPNLDMYPPSLRWYQIRQPVTEDDGAETGTGAGTSSVDATPNDQPEHPEWARREAEQAERSGARDHRRRWLNELWTGGLGQVEAPASIARALLRDVIHHAYCDIVDPDPASTMSVFLGDDTARDPVDSREWSMLQLAFVTWWQCRGDAAEVELANFGPEYWEPTVAGYLEVLRDVLGYELTDVEDALLDTYYANADADGDD